MSPRSSLMSFASPARMTCALLVPLLVFAFAAWRMDPAALPFHPHFPKTVECKLSKDLTLTVRYQTVTFDRDGAAKMAPGAAWHLAGAEFETSGPIVVGGKPVAAGRYALNARKLAKGWELVLHPGKRFSTAIGADAHVLATTLIEDSPLFEHLCIDVQPAGDKTHTTLHLEVRFDRLLARTLIEIPQ